MNYVNIILSIIKRINLISLKNFQNNSKRVVFIKKSSQLKKSDFLRAKITRMTFDVKNMFFLPILFCVKLKNSFSPFF